MNPKRSPLVTCTPFAFVLLLVALWGVWMLTRHADGPAFDPNAAPRTVEARGDLAAEERAQIALFRAASPSVAHITTSTITRDRFRMRATEVPQGTGSGFVWDDRGYIVTNYHVIENASRAYVSLDGEQTFVAEAVGAEPSFDIAVLKIDPAGAKLRPIPVGTSSDLQVGQRAFAIGNPFGLDHTLSTGVVSGLNREIQSPAGTTIRGAVQTDAAINPGNSGGPLLDSAGRLIGMNTVIATPSGGSVGVGFAIPVDTIQRVVPGLIRNGRFDRPRLGIRAAGEQIARYLNVKGVVVGEVEAGSGAERAGLRPLTFDQRDLPTKADVITRVAGVVVASVEEIWDVMGGKKAGDVVRVDVLRDGKTISVDVQLMNGA